MRGEGEDRRIPDTLTDKQLKPLEIQLFDLDLKKRETHPLVTQYFLPIRLGGILSNSSSPIDDRFTEYNKCRTEKAYRDAGWSNCLAGAFGGHAGDREGNVFTFPWKQLMQMLKGLLTHQFCRTVALTEARSHLASMSLRKDDFSVLPLP